FIYNVLVIPSNSVSIVFPYTTLFRSPSLLLGIVLGQFAEVRHLAVRLSYVASQVSEHIFEPVKNLLRVTHLIGRGNQPGCIPVGDRKSTRLNSSHQIISYAVFCLKKT